MELFEHQKKGVELLTEHDSFGLFWDMGTGKTLVMIYHLSNLILSGCVSKVLWMAPKSALGAVERDLRMLRNCGLSYRADAVEEAITLLNYEKVSRKTSKWRKVVEETEWDCVVFDEAHCLARPSSNRTKYLIGGGRSKGIALKAKYRYAMTGTPVTNSRYEDFWSFMCLMMGGKYYNYNVFESMYLKVRYIPGTYAKVIQGYKDCSTLIEEVASYSQSVEKKDCLDLPERMPDNAIKIPFKGGSNPGIGKSTKAIYEDAMENVIECSEEVFDNALVKTLRLRQIASGSLNVDGEYVSLKCDKLDYAMELITGNPHKTVVFYEFKNSFFQLTKALEKAGIPYMYLNGSQKNKNIWMDFQEATEDECRVILVQYKSGNAGIDLYTASDTIYYEPCVSSTVLDQSRSRTHRNGVSRACTFTFLITEGTIEEDIYEKLRCHEDFNEKLWLELKMKERNEKYTRKDDNE